MTFHHSILASTRKSLIVILSVALLLSPIPPVGWGLLFRTGIAYANAAEPGSSSQQLSQTSQKTVLPFKAAKFEMRNFMAPNGEPLGVLIDIGLLQGITDTMQYQPVSLGTPLSISRIQSAYRIADAISDTLIITFTVTNNQAPSDVPELSSLATITDSLATISRLDSSSDPNTIHNVSVVDNLNANASFVSALPMPDRISDTDIDHLTFNLGDIPPLSSVTATLVLSMPTAVTDFFNLDVGATAWGTLQNRMINAQARPASLAPDTLSGEPIGDWLKWTIDADRYDNYMLGKAAELGQDPLRMFEYVRSLGYESYKGSLRGTRGTLWSEAGNSLDKASLLIAMLRASGIPSRYRHGNLNLSDAKSLILSMFAEPQKVIGTVPAGIALAKPENDQQLLAQTEDHWWVEAYLPGQGWHDLDPSFKSAVVGQKYVLDERIATDGTDRIAEVPDILRHKVTIKVKVEKYDQLSYLTGGFSYVYPLTHTFSAVELTGKPVKLGHLVATQNAGLAAMFDWTRHTYTPFFSVGYSEIAFEGQPFQDFISNYPFANFLSTAEWLIFDMRDPDGSMQTETHEVFDRVGFTARQAGGTVALKLDNGSAASVTEYDSTVVSVSTSRTSPQYTTWTMLDFAHAIDEYRTVGQEYGVASRDL